MDKACYNPYHFVPVAKRGEPQQRHDLNRDDLLSPTGAASTTHDRYVEETHSGRLVCRLTTKTPLVVGAEQTRHPNAIGDVEPYMVMGPGDLEKRPAIPGSSLRGLIGSLAEAASNSAMRVLTAGFYSYRKPFEPKHTLSAIGLIVKDEKGDLKLKPVALPTLERAVDQSRRPLVHYIVPPRYRRVFPRPALKVYVGDYDWVRRDNGYRTSQSENQICPWNVAELQYNPQGNLDQHPSLRCKPSPDNPKFLVAQNADSSVAERAGLLRILGCWGDRTAHIPEGKKHELWLPLPGLDVKALPIEPRAIERFHALADERTEDSLKAKNPVMPFQPLDTPRNQDPEKLGHKFRVKPGDLVYFDVSEAGVVVEIALSAIWRGRVETKDSEPAGAFEFFEAVDTNLTPFHPGRKQITIAERMFGFVEEMDPDNKSNGEQGLALAGRIRFSDGLLPPNTAKEAALERDFVPMRILSSPKPPSPALYFKPEKGPARWIGKFELKPGNHHPQGRKMYLHHFVKPGTQPWRTKDPGENADQKNRVRPVRSGQEFFFHIDFDNLTDAEMGLLLYALAPEDKFHHKLGMGKPLGLGSVKIEVLEWNAIDRKKRYSVAGLQARRYVVRRPIEQGFWNLRNQSLSSGLVSAGIHKSICLLGDYAGAPPAEQVHTPTLGDQPDAETETFKWFVANDGGLKEANREIPAQHSFLQPLPERGNTLPTLPRPDWTARRRRF